MKYSEKKITKAVTEIYERVLSPQEIKANELIEKFDTFMKETYPLLEYYEKKGNLLKIKVDNITTDDIFDEIKKVIK